MTKLIAVFTATGQQGGSVIRYILNDPELSRQYQIRAPVRNPESSAAKALPSEVEVVQADQYDRESLENALTGVNAVFINTAPDFSENSLEVESQAIKTIADVAVEKGVDFIIQSTLAGVSAGTDGRLSRASPFDAKFHAEQYIRALPVKSAFLMLGTFMENFQGAPFMAPKQQPDGTWVLSRPHAPSTRVPMIDATEDTGKFVGPMLAEPEIFDGKTVYAGHAMYSWEEVVAALSRSTGQTVKYQQVTVDEFGKSLPPIVADIFVDAMQWYESPGYFGPQTAEKMRSGLKVPRVKLTSFDEHLAAHPFHLGDTEGSVSFTKATPRAVQ